jgi:ribonuclease Z
MSFDPSFVASLEANNAKNDNLDQADEYIQPSKHSTSTPSSSAKTSPPTPATPFLANATNFSPPAFSLSHLHNDSNNGSDDDSDTDSHADCPAGGIYIPERAYWNKVKSLRLPNIPHLATLRGYSVAARHTALWIPEWRLMLDCGVPHNFVPEHIFITHSHLDHTSALCSSIIDTGAVTPKIIVPKPCEKHIRDHIHYTYVMTKNNENPKIHNKYKLVSVVPDQRLDIVVNKMNWIVDVIKCTHTLPCSGYGFSEKRNKLFPEYEKIKDDQDKIYQEDNTQPTGQAKLAELVKSGVQISGMREYPLFCFLGDTNEKVLDNPILNKWKTIIIECSFLDADHMQHAKKDKHMHWLKLKPYILSRPDTTFILIHFSQRYTFSYIDTFFKNENIPNIYPWVYRPNLNDD